MILNIILTILSIAVMMMFTINVWDNFNRVNRDIRDIQNTIGFMATISLQTYVRGNVETLKDMKETFQRLVENEQYEEAKKLKATINKLELHTHETIDKLKTVCKDGYFEYVEVNVNKTKNDE